MRERRFYFVVVLILFFNVENFSQIKSECIKLPINYSTVENFQFQKQLNLGYFPKDATIILKKLNGDSGKIKAPHSLFVLSPSYYSNNLSFFCSKELKLEKITSVPFRFRLGSLDYVNYLEQKPNALKPR
jgi:hypothetical protein